MVDNAEWLVELRAVDFMRDVGKHFTVNYMLQKDSVQGRMDAGISYTEFSYMLLQAYDFLELRRRHDVRMQMGGSDQWGNITAGIELIRRSPGLDAHAITVAARHDRRPAPSSARRKAGAVWLDASLTSPYKFYQFLVNVDDRDAGRYLRYFTLLDARGDRGARRRARRASGEARGAAGARARRDEPRARRRARSRRREEVSGLLFGGADPKSLSRDALLALQAGDSGVHDRAEATEHRRRTTCSKRRLVGTGRAVQEQGRHAADAAAGRRVSERPAARRRTRAADTDDLLGGEFVLVRKGRRATGW